MFVFKKAVWEQSFTIKNGDRILGPSLCPQNTMNIGLSEPRPENTTKIRTSRGEMLPEKNTWLGNHYRNRCFVIRLCRFVILQFELCVFSVFVPLETRKKGGFRVYTSSQLGLQLCFRSSVLSFWFAGKHREMGFLGGDRFSCCNTVNIGIFTGRLLLGMIRETTPWHLCFGFS